MSEAKLFSDIVGFLEQKLTSGAVPEDEKESLELAIDCIRETFHVKPGASNGDLLAIYEKGLAGAAPASGDSASAPAAAPPSLPEVSPELKAEADALKAKGNKLMAARDFSGAADAYTEAIAKNPTNPMYFSNRAAAYTHLTLHAKAVEDARRATELDPSYSKAWSRLGLALWAQGDIKGSLDAYEAGLKAEGDSPTEAMKKDYENVKRRYDEEMAKKPASADGVAKAAAPEGAGAGAGAEAEAGAGGGFDFSKISGLLNNPQIQQMAKNLMSDPSALSNLMNSPMAQQMKNSFANGKTPNMSDLGNMMNNPEMQDMMKNLK